MDDEQEERVQKHQRPYPIEKIQGIFSLRPSLQNIAFFNFKITTATITPTNEKPAIIKQPFLTVSIRTFVINIL